ncbi:MAG: ABC transporter substrate-binding protein [Acidimicrobiia bacterium]|nr:ABC transporter substrate-binding protein [Acidimicrobiia bacterium]
MRTRFLVTRGALLLAALLFIGACGGDDEPEPEAPAEQATTTAPTTTAATANEMMDVPDEPDTPTTTQAPTTTAAAPPAEPVRIRAAVTGDEGTLNPYTYISGFPGWNLLMLQYDSLTQVDADGVPQPWLASEVTTNADLTEYTVALVEGVTWHDGQPLTAHDVKFTADYFINNAAASRFARDLAGVTEVVVVDDLTATFVLEATNPGFNLVALADVPIIPQHIWESVTDPEGHQFEGGTNIGSGPFRMTDYDEGQAYRFAANPDYFRGPPSVDELVVVVFADDAGAQAAIRTGEVDVIFERIPPEQIDLLDAQDPLDVLLGPEFTTQMINYDATIRPFDDVAVRKAIDLAMNRQDIVDTVFLGAATVGSSGWIHPGHSSYNPAIVPVHDPAAANALLDEAGYLDTDGDGVREYDGGQPMSFEIITNAPDSLRLRIAELTVEMLGEIGIQTSVSSVETATWENAVWPGFDVSQGRNYNIAMWGWSAPVQANPLRLPSLIQSTGFLNLTGFANAEIDELSDRLAVETDAAEREAILGRMQEIIADQLPFVLLAYPDGAYVYDSDVYSDWEFIAGQGIVSKLSLLPPSARP